MRSRRSESMLSTTRRSQLYYMLVPETWPGDPVCGGGKASMLKSISPHLRQSLWSIILCCMLFFPLLFSLCSPFFLSFIFILCFFSLCSHRETADHIEAVASRAVRESKQAFSFLMDLLQDNSTEEYTRNLKEQWAKPIKLTHTHTHTHAHKQRECLSGHITHNSYLLTQKAAQLPGFFGFCTVFPTKCTYPCIITLSPLFHCNFLFIFF